MICNNATKIIVRYSTSVSERVAVKVGTCMREALEKRTRYEAMTMLRWTPFQFLAALRTTSGSYGSPTLSSPART